jgi:hypothetical protein
LHLSLRGIPEFFIQTVALVPQLLQVAVLFAEPTPYLIVILFKLASVGKLGVECMLQGVPFILESSQEKVWWRRQVFCLIVVVLSIDA